jgi:hypothetical protein
LAEPGPGSRRGQPPRHPVGTDASGRPRVFGVEARAIPLSIGGGSLLEQGIDVALLMTPRSGEPFAIRAPRGAIGSGKHFVLRCAGLERQRGALARVTAVSELGIHFDLVTAEIVQSSELTPHAAPDIAPLPRPPRSTLQADMQPAHQRLLARDAERARLRRRATASAVQINGVTTIAIDVSATLLTPVQMGELVTLHAPRDEIARGAYFALRYFDSVGAKRAIVRADAVRALAGMLDEVDAELIRLPTPAEERQSYRAPFECYFLAEVRGSRGTRTVRGRITDLSAGGIGFRVTSNLATGERLRISDPSLADLDGAELFIVRRDPRDTQRYGAQFVEPNRGAATLTTVLGLEQAEREHRRRAHIVEIRRTRGASAAPLTAADIETLRNRRMGTRAHSA